MSENRGARRDTGLETFPSPDQRSGNLPDDTTAGEVERDSSSANLCVVRNNGRVRCTRPNQLLGYPAAFRCAGFDAVDADVTLLEIVIAGVDDHHAVRNSPK